jgi:hypothetical protein
MFLLKKLKRKNGKALPAPKNRTKKAYKRCEGKTLLVTKPGAKCMTGHLHSPATTTPGKSFPYSLVTKLSGPDRQSGGGREEKDICPIGNSSPVT